MPHWAVMAGTAHRCPFARPSARSYTGQGKHSSQAGFNVEDVMNMNKPSQPRSRKPGDRDRSAEYSFADMAEAAAAALASSTDRLVV